VHGLADLSAELPRRRRIRLRGERRHPLFPAGKASIAPPSRDGAEVAVGAASTTPEPAIEAAAERSFLGIGIGGWTGAAALYAVIGAAAILLSWNAAEPEAWPDAVPVFHVLFEAPPAEPSALPVAAAPEPAEMPPAPPMPPAVEAAPAPAEVAPPPPPPAPAPAKALPPPPSPKPHPPQRHAAAAAARAPVAPVTPAETQVAAGTTVMPAPPLASRGDAAYAGPSKIGECDRVYPARAQQLGLQGRVLIHVDISPDGSVTPSVKSSSGHAILDNAALAKARTCRFAPAMRGGVAVSGSVELPFDFRLQD
jgi:protein TonB